MITRTTLALLGALLACGCGESNSGVAGSGGGGVGAGTGGEGGRGATPLEALAAEIGCPIFDAVLTPPPPGVGCPAGCTPAGGANTEEDAQYLVACIPDAFLVRLTPPTAITMCMASPVDRVDYQVANPLVAQALADMCWVLCSTSPLEPIFQDWLELDFDAWLERCGAVWEL